MNVLDWIIAGIFVILISGAAYFVYPPYGAIIGLPLGIFLVYRAKQARDRNRRKSY